MYTELLLRQLDLVNMLLLRQKYLITVKQLVLNLLVISLLQLQLRKLVLVVQLQETAVLFINTNILDPKSANS